MFSFFNDRVDEVNEQIRLRRDAIYERFKNYVPPKSDYTSKTEWQVIENNPRNFVLYRTISYRTISFTARYAMTGDEDAMEMLLNGTQYWSWDYSTDSWEGFLSPEEAWAFRDRLLSGKTVHKDPLA